MQLPSSRTLNLILIPACVLLCLLLLHRCGNNCSQSAPVIDRLIHDTTYLKSKPIEIITPVPYPRYIHSVADTETVFALADDSSYSPYCQGYKDASEALQKLRFTCRDTVYYNDTLTSNDHWRLFLSEAITGNRLISRLPMVQDLRPVITTSVTTQLPAPKERIRFYGGADFILNSNYSNRWGIDLAGMLTIPKGYAFRYAYDLHNNTHTAGVYVLIKARK